MKKYKLEWNNESYTAYYLKSPADIKKGASYLLNNPRKLYGLDIETGKQDKYKSNDKAGLDPHLSFIRLIQVYDPATRKIFVFDIRRDISNDPLSCFLSTGKFIAHNAIFEIKHLQKAGIEIDCSCSMIMAQFVEVAERSPFEPSNEEQEERYRPTKGFGLKAVVQKYFSVVIPKEQQVSDWSKEELSDEQIHYAALDAVLPYMVGKKLYPIISEYKMLRALKMYKDMQYVIADMELNGMGFDKEAHTELIMSWELKKIEAEIDCKKYFGGVNLRSPKQLHEWVENNVDDKLKKLWPRSTKTNNFSFNKTQLQPLESRHEGIACFIRYKKYATLLSTFGDSLQGKINPRTNRIHCSFSLGHTRTGRLSSRDPNLQNMPARGDSFRHIFVPDKGNVLVVADFSQVEIRVAGELSKDPEIRGAYKRGEDLHSAIVAALEDKDIKDVTKEERQLGKAINFGLQFGMGAKKLAFYAASSYGVEMSETDAQRAWDTYHRKYSVYGAWCQSQRRMAESTGFIRTPMGKVRRLAEGEYYTKAINTPVQGGAAEVSYASLIKLREKLKYSSAKILNTVHDEIILECPEKDSEGIARIMEICMQQGMLTLFPKAVGVTDLVEANVGLNWSEAK